MNRETMRSASLSAIAAVAFLLSGPALAGDTHTITAMPNLSWSYNGVPNKPSHAVIVDDLKVGDIVEIKIPGGNHGFIPTVKGPPLVETRDPIQLCTDAPNSKPNAVLRETQCGADTQVGKQFVGSLRMEVLPAFHDSVDFHCVVHKGLMPGTLSLKAAAAK